VKPEPWSAIFSDLERVILAGNTNWSHPHFFAYYPTANSYPAVIGEILSASLATIGFSWVSQQHIYICSKYCFFHRNLDHHVPNSKWSLPIGWQS
jgi:hypothetical protein